MKKLWIASALALLLFSLPAHAAFSDVGNVHPNRTAIDSLVDQQILEGYEDNTFLPDQAVNRAEAVKIVLLGMGIEVEESSISGLLLEDVQESDWFFPYVSTAVSKGILNGYDDGTFRPGQTVNRAEALKMLTLAAEVSLEESASVPYVDVDDEAWFAPYASYAWQWNLEPVQTDGLWHPEHDMSRANMSELVYRMQQVQESGESYDASATWQRRQFPTVNLSLLMPHGWDLKTEGVGAMWLLDENNGQLSLLDPYDNGATLLMTRYPNYEGAGATELFNRVRGGTDAANSQGSVQGMPMLTVFTEDGELWREWYILVENGTLVHLQALRGNGNYSASTEDIFEKIIAEIRYDGSEVTTDEAVAAIRSAIQVDGTGSDVMTYLSDWSLIETDSIGVGTGPVDYFYSPSADITIKYERSFDVILDLQDGQGTAF
jgi:hypothetical protein